MASARLFDALRAAWGMAEAMSRPHNRNEAERARGVARMERVTEAQRAANSGMTDRQIGEAFPDLRRDLFTVSELRRHGWADTGEGGGEADANLS